MSGPNGRRTPWASAEWERLGEAWVRTYAARGLSPNTSEMRSYHLRRFSVQVAPLEPADITQEHIEAVIFREGMSPNYRIAARSSARSFFGWAHKRGHLPTDPSADLLKPREPAPRPRPVTDDAYTAALAAATARGPHWACAIRLAGVYGLRRAEVAGLHRDALIGEPGAWALRILGKGGKERILPVPDDFADELSAAWGAGGWLFPRQALPHGEGHATPHWIGMVVSRMLPDGYTMHKLRHRAGTQAYRRSGNDIYLASKMLGHSSVATTAAYVDPDLSRLRQVLG